MFTRHVMTAIAVTLLFSASTYATDIKTIYIDIVGEGEFEVIYSRATKTGTGAAFGGLIGAGIQSGVEANMDTKKTKELSPLIKKDTWKTQFLDTLNNKLEAEGFKAVWVEDKGDIGDGVVLKVYPESYGFKVVDTSTYLVSAFIAFKAQFSNGQLKKGQKSEKEGYYITNKNQHPFENLLKEDSPANSDLETVLNKAARRLANKIIYSMKE